MLNCRSQIFPLLILMLSAIGLSGAASAQSIPSKIVHPDEVYNSIAKDGTAKVIIHMATANENNAAKAKISRKETRRAGLADVRQKAAPVLNAYFPTGRSRKGKPVKKFNSLAAIAAEVSNAELEMLRGDPRVLKIEPDRLKTHSLNTSLPLIGVPSANSAAADAEPSGNGRTVAVIDTGVQANHPFIGAARVVAEACFVTFATCPNGGFSQTGPGAAAPQSGGEHGTHVAGIAVGHHGTGSTVNRGVASRANLVAINIFGSGGGATTSDIILALEFVEDLVSTNGNPYKIDSVNMSLGGGSYSGYCDGEAEKTIIDVLRAQGVLTVIAAGNSYATAAMSSPGCISSAVSVASTSRSGVVSSFTNISPVTTLFAPGGDFGGCIDSSIPGNAYASYCGTSMAAPHVAGVIALMRQASPTATANQIVSALTTNMTTVSDTRSGGSSSAPFLNVPQAIANLGTQVTNTVSISRLGAGSGVISSSPAGLACTGSTCSGSFMGGSTLRLVATASDASFLRTWGGGAASCGTSTTCTITVPAAAGNPVSVTATFDSAAVPLASALDSSLAYTTPLAGDSAAWYGQIAVLRSGDTTGTARSGNVDDNQTSSMQTTVTGPGTLTFFWSVSSEQFYDYLDFYIDGVRQAGGISGSVPFTQQTWAISAGSHVLTWKFAKDYSISEGYDSGFIDRIQMTGSGDGGSAVSYTLTISKNTGRLGIITSLPAGVNCTTNCAMSVSSFARGQRVTLSAQPARNKKFVRWTGACSGTKPTCVLVMDSNKFLSAVFK